MTDEQKKQIDGMSYRELLRIWRFTPLGSDNKLLKGEAGEYFAKVMFEKRDKCDHVAVSKAVGWEKSS